MRKILILGKMDNDTDFSTQEEKIRKDGDIPINQIKVLYALPEEINTSDFIVICIELARISDAVLLLPGWEKDLLCRLVRKNALELDKDVMEG